MYIGIGTIVLIVIIALVILMIRRLCPQARSVLSVIGMAFFIAAGLDPVVGRPAALSKPVTGGVSSLAGGVVGAFMWPHLYSDDHGRRNGWGFRVPGYARLRRLARGLPGGGIEVTAVDPEPVEARLRDIQSITDAALSRLDDRELLAELLDRTREILQADTAAVLLLDFSSGQLVATAAAGLEEEVGQGVRIPVGRGFAGRIAAEHRPVILDHVDHTTVLNPILWAKGIRSMMGVPMVAGGEVIGVLHVGSLTPREFTSGDVELLQLAADRAAAAAKSMSAQADRVAAAALQRSLVPSTLPVVPGAEMAARYIPGSGGVGGDWYDMFALPSGELCVVIGDVAGSGLAAAVIMGRMRSVLRAYALETSDPAEVLARLDRKMRHFEPDALATVGYAVIDPGLDRMRVCLAGHFPPVIARPGQPAELASAAAGLVIGAASEAHRPVSTVPIPPGTLLCFYTDGLIERPGEVIDDGLARLCQAVMAESADAACSAVMRALVGSEPARDDIALLMIRRQISADPPGTHAAHGEVDADA